ncbi:MAG: hypothetical protein KKA28_19230 [Planctomycetes bacterium]|nr:hypothetical protein [Planctomycetota bacterium]MCG2684443.1 hypothetical protein [Planctomycetales bacterium]
MTEDDKHIVARGRLRVVEYAIRSDGSMPAKDFLFSLSKRDRQHLLNRFLHLANGGEQQMNNDQVFKAERPPFWAFKRWSMNSPKGGKGMIRIPCFRIDDRWILTHGFWKPPQSEWPECHFTTAQQIYREVMLREKRKT